MKSPQDIIEHYSRRDECMSDTVKAKTYWVWTELAERKNPAYSRTGYPVWENYLYEAPRFMVTDGLVVDASEVDGNEGQVTLLDLGV